MLDFIFWSYIFLLLCLQTGEKFQIDRNEYVVDYESNCKYKARVQIIVSEKCGAGSSDPSDEVEYGTSEPING